MLLQINKTMCFIFFNKNMGFSQSLFLKYIIYYVTIYPISNQQDSWPVVEIQKFPTVYFTNAPFCLIVYGTWVYTQLFH